MAWSLGYVGDVKKLESVQKWWTYEVDGLSEKPYEIRLPTIRQYSIEGCIIRSDLIQIWEMLNGIVYLGPT